MVLHRAAIDYIRRGYAVVPVPAGGKGPVVPGWQRLRIAERDVPVAFRTAANIGVILGAASGGLVDVDLDCDDAREIAWWYLPETDAISGRTGAKCSHWWYRCDGLKTTRYRDPITRKSVIEVRGDGCQTLVGPSVHPSGDVYDTLRGKPARVEAATLLGAVKRMAEAIVVMRHGEDAIKGPQKTYHATPARTPADDYPKIAERAAKYLRALPAAISGSGGHNATYYAATALVHGFALTRMDALLLLKTVFNPRCKPPWSERELEHKVREAATREHKYPYGWLLK